MQNNAMLVILIWAIIIRILMINPDNIIKRTLWPTCYSVLALYAVSGLYNTLMVIAVIAFSILYAIVVVKIINYFRQ